MRIGVDIMGGDFWPTAPVEGAILANRELGAEVRIVLVGDEKVILEELKKQGGNPEAFDIVHCSQMIDMHDTPTKSITQKKDSSISVGIGLVKTGNIDGFISAGNTGAMLVASIMMLGKIEGVLRPTIGVLLPNLEDSLTLLCDVGANLDCKADALSHFGILGSIFMENVLKVENPRVALLNVGEEESKGPQVIQATYEILKANNRLNFVGNLEGRDLYAGKAEVFVCDGYAGNIVLKFGESMYDVLRKRFPGDEFIESLNFENYGGVPILGIKGISIIGHGISTGKAISSMIYSAVNAVDSQLVQKIEAAFASAHAENSKE